MCTAVASPTGAAKVSVNGNSSSARNGRGKSLMSDEARLRDGLGSRGDDGQGSLGDRKGSLGDRQGSLGDGQAPRGSSQRSVAAAGAAAPGTVTSPAAATGVYAALDLGTNNCRLLIACPTDDGFRVVDSFSRIIRLGEGISATGSISDAAIERAITALCICRDKIQSRKARRLRLIATEACRAASNA